MKLFSAVYNKVISWAQHRNAPRYLGILSFAESSFFPIPPDVMLIPMVLAKPGNWVKLALLTTVTSVLGGVAGYFIGFFAFEISEPVIIQWGYGEKIELAKGLFSEWGVWIIFAAGFSPIPYKVFTITAGVISMALIPFIFASIIGRGARFFIVSALLAWSGPKMEPVITRYIEWLGWFVVGALILLILLTQV